MVFRFDTKNADFMNTYMPILFTDQYFSLISASLHVMSIDYKFRMTEVSLSEFASWSEEERKRKIKELMMMKRNDMLIENNNKKGGIIVGYMREKLCV